MDAQVEAGEGDEEGRKEGGDSQGAGQVFIEQEGRREGGRGVTGRKGEGCGRYMGDQGKDFRIGHKGTGLLEEVLQDEVGEKQGKKKGHQGADADGSCLFENHEEQG